MIDPFLKENGATRFVPGSHKWPSVSDDSIVDATEHYPNEALGYGEAGTMIVFDAAIWHGHTANVTSRDRRSIQGYFVRRNVQQGFDFRGRLPDAVRVRLTPLARHLLALDEGP